MKKTLRTLLAAGLILLLLTSGFGSVFADQTNDIPDMLLGT